ncbi:MAG: phosphatidate cytidylyltransferase [Pseudomonadota bacterium]
MKTRLLTGVPAALALVALVLWGSFGLLRLIVVLIGACAYLEFDSLMFAKKSLVRRLTMFVLVSIQIFQLGGDYLAAFHTYILCNVLILISGVLGSARSGQFELAIKEVTYQCLGFAYMTMLFGFLFSVVNWPEVGRSYLILLFLIVFVGDTAAYFGGMKFGKRKLASEISPKKTVEGSISAVLASVLAAIIWTRFVYPESMPVDRYWWIIFLTPLLSGLAQLGDLFESVLKRSQMQKDSGAFLPGHGGILDRVDGLAFAAPVFYLCLYYIWETA